MSLDQCGLCGRNLTLDVTAETIPHMECQICLAPPSTAPNTRIEGGEEQELQPLKLCLSCFCNPDKHPWDHPYIVARDLDTLASPIGPRGWTQRHDFALLAGVEKLGYGNWEEIHQVALKRAQTPEACKRRFEQLRLLIYGEIPLAEEDRSVEDAQLRDKAEFGRTAPGANLVGYLPLREEFDSVYANEAEVVIADMVFGLEDEDDKERGRDWFDLKLKVLKTYNLKLDVREARRQFVLQRGLLDFQRIQDIRKKLSTPPSVSSNDISADLESLARFSTLQEHEQFEKGIAREWAIRDEIRKLQQYRAMGIRTFDEIESYNRQAAKRHSLQREEETVQDNIVQIPIGNDDQSQDKFGNVLSQEELNLCTLCKLTPTRYVIAKECLIKEAMKNGGCISRPDAIALLTIEMTSLDRMLDFFVKCEWITREEEPSYNNSNNRSGGDGQQQHLPFIQMVMNDGNAQL